MESKLTEKKLFANVSNKHHLIQELNDFSDWLIHKKIVKDSFIVMHEIDFPYADVDTIMSVNTKINAVSFNTFILNRCSNEYYKIVILHEFFHLIVQKVPNKDDVTKIKDDFGTDFMKLIDIEADFYVALYLKEKHNYTLVKYWLINYEGGTIFLDKWIRIPKFERFVGTLLSVSKMFLCHKDYSFENYDLYLPAISPIYTEETFHVLIIKKEHIYFDEIKADYNDFVKLKDCYKDVSNISKKNYVKDIIEFSCKALNENISNEMNIEIEEIKS